MFFFVIVLFFFMYSVSKRLYKSEKEITEIIRKIAIKEAKK